jgi:hypothetical protein
VQVRTSDTVIIETVVTLEQSWPNDVSPNSNISVAESGWLRAIDASSGMRYASF